MTTHQYKYGAKVFGELTTNRLFVYGIFLDKRNRYRFGMYNERYETVQGYITEGSSIVQAKQTDNSRASLTGLTVDLDPRYWDDLDALEAGYDRRIVTTNSGEKVWMYTAKQYEEEEE